MKKIILFIMITIIFSTFVYGAQYISFTIKDWIFDEDVIAEITNIKPEDIAVRRVVDLREKIKSKKQERLDDICEKMIKYGYLFPIDKGVHVFFGKRVNWVGENFIKIDGWQLSGWSKVTLDGDFNPRRLKIGYITPELYGEEAMRLHEERNIREFVEWKEKVVDDVFGVSYTIEF